MADKFENYSGGLAAPATGGQAVVAGSNFGQTCRALYVGTTGDLTVVMKDGSEVAFKTYQGWLPVRATQVKSAGLTAADIVAVW